MANEHEQRLNVVVARRIRGGREADYEAAMKSFVAWAVAQPGHEGFQIMRPLAGSRDYTVISHFADEAARRAFTASDGYRDWMVRLGRLTEGEPQIREMTGLEGWFTPPGSPEASRLPPWKMAVATFCGVLPTSIVLDQTIGSVIGGWPYLTGQAAFSACMVALLTWLVMPLVTRGLHRWLYPGAGREQRSET